MAKTIDARLCELEKRAHTKDNPWRPWLLAEELPDRPGMYQCDGKVYTEAELSALWAGQHGIIIERAGAEAAL
jgi:hypothetical protein